eukprot:symbB.v1.2.004050.t1/scaffold228.1/size260974/19
MCTLRAEFGGVQAQRNASVEDGAGFSGGDLLDVHRVVQPSLADAEVPTEIQQKSIDDVCETSEVELTVNQGGVHKAADQPEGGAGKQSDVPEIPTLNLTKGSEDLIPPQGDQIEHGRAAAVPIVEMVAGVDLSSDRKPLESKSVPRGDRPAAIVEVRRSSSQEASEEGSSSGTSPIENLIGTQENSSEAGSSSSDPAIGKCSAMEKKSMELLSQLQSKLNRSHPMCVPRTDKMLGSELCQWSILADAMSASSTSTAWWGCPQFLSPLWSLTRRTVAVTVPLVVFSALRLVMLSGRRWSFAPSTRARCKKASEMTMTVGHLLQRSLKMDSSSTGT